MSLKKEQIKIEYIEISKLKSAEYNPRKWSQQQTDNLKESIRRFGIVNPLVVNIAPNRKYVVIGGHFRKKIFEQLGIKQVPVVYLNIPDIKKEKELNLRLNKNMGEWDFDLLLQIDENILKNVGFDDLIPFEQIDVNKEWEGMPEYNSSNGIYRSIIIHFEKQKDVDDFCQLLKQKITDKTKFIYYPEKLKQKINNVFVAKK